MKTIKIIISPFHFVAKLLQVLNAGHVESAIMNSRTGENSVGGCSDMPLTMKSGKWEIMLFRVGNSFQSRSTSHCCAGVARQL